MDDSGQRLGLRLRLWLFRQQISLANPRDKAIKAIRRADELRQRGRMVEARVLYTYALQCLDQVGIHHLRKKVLQRLEHVR